MVYVAITASTHLAIARISTRKDSFKSPVTVDSSYTFRQRKDFEPKLTEFGAYVVVSVLSILIPLVKSDDNVGF